MKRRVLFLCTHDSARSQMAEGVFPEKTGPSLFVPSARLKQNFGLLIVATTAYKLYRIRSR